MPKIAKIIMTFNIYIGDLKNNKYKKGKIFPKQIIIEFIGITLS